MAVFVFTGGVDNFVGDPAQIDLFVLNNVENLSNIDPADTVVADPDNPGIFDIFVWDIGATDLVLDGSLLAINGIEQISFAQANPYVVTFPDNNFINQNANDGGTLSIDGRNLPVITVDAGLVTAPQRQIAVFLSVGSDSVIGTAGDDIFSQELLAGDSLSGGDDTLFGGLGVDVLGIDINVLTAADRFDGGGGIDGVQIEGDWDLTTGTGVLAGISNVEEFIIGVTTDGTRSLVATTDYVAAVGGTLLFVIGDQQTEDLTINGAGLAGPNRLVVVDNAGNGPALMIGGAGDDSLLGGAQADTLIGAAGNDTLIGGAGNDSLVAGGGNDTITGNDSISGDLGDDSIDLRGAGAARVSGGDGADTVRGGPADFNAVISLDGGAGIDTVLLATPGVLNLAALSTATGFERLIGSAGDDTFVASTQQLQAFTFISGDTGTDILATSGVVLDLVGRNIDQIEFLSTTNTVGTTFRLPPATLQTVLQGILGGPGFDSIQLVGGTLANTTSQGGFAGTTGIERLEFGQDSLSGGQSLVLTDGFLGVNGLVSGTTRTFEVSPGLAAGITVDGSGLTVATNNLILGNSVGSDTLIGGPGNDAIDLSSGASLSGSDSIDGGAGNDTVFLDSAADLDSGDIINGGAGFDRLSITGGSFVDLRVAAVFTGIEEVDAPDSGLTLILAANAALTAIGGAGNDLIAGRAGAESILGGNGDDVLFGGNSADTLIGGEGSDTLVGDNQGGFPGGQPAGDRLDGGVGADQLFGEDGADTLIGGAGADVLVGGTGNDILNGGDDDDTLFGSEGSDTVSGDDGNDVVVGFQASNSDPFGVAQTDPDTLDGGGGADTLFGGGGGDSLQGGDGDDALLGFGGADRLDGGTGNDQIVGYLLLTDPDADTLIGGGGNDSLFAGGGTDSLDGGDGSDFLLGDDGADTLDGGAGDDFLFGGAGADRFRFAPGGGSDLVIDFVRGDDLVDLSAFALAGPGALGSTVTVQVFDNAIRLLFGTGDTLSIIGVTDAQASDFVF